MTEEAKRLSPGQCIMHFLHCGELDKEVWGDLTLREAIAAYLDADDSKFGGAVPVSELVVLCFNSQHPQAAFWVLATALALASDIEYSAMSAACDRMVGP